MLFIFIYRPLRGTRTFANLTREKLRGYGFYIEKLSGVTLIYSAFNYSLALLLRFFENSVRDDIGYNYVLNPEMRNLIVRITHIPCDLIAVRIVPTAARNGRAIFSKPNV